MALSNGVPLERELPEGGLGMTEEALSTLPIPDLNERILNQTTALNRQLNIVPTVEQQAALYDVLLTREGLGVNESEGAPKHISTIEGVSGPEIRAMHII